MYVDKLSSKAGLFFLFLFFTFTSAQGADIEANSFGDIDFDTLPPTFTAKVKGVVYALSIDEKEIDWDDEDEFIEEKHSAIEFAELDAKAKLASYLEGGAVQRKLDEETIIDTQKTYNEEGRQSKDKKKREIRRKSSSSSLDAKLPPGVKILYVKISANRKNVLVAVGIPK